MELDLPDLFNFHGEQALPTSRLLSNAVDKLTHDTVTHTDASINYSADLNQNQGQGVIFQIEDIFESIADSILNQESHLVIKLKTRYKPKKHVHNDTSGVIRSLPDVDGMKAIKFPSRKPHEAWKFGRFCGFARLKHE